MSRTRRQVFSSGQSIQRCLAASETSIDTGLIAQANLVAALLTARLELGFAGAFRRELVLTAGRTLTQGIEQRERVLDLHQELGALSERFGIDPQSLGDSGDKNAPDVMPNIPLTGLSIVAAA